MVKIKFDIFKGTEEDINFEIPLIIEKNFKYFKDALKDKKKIEKYNQYLNNTDILDIIDDIKYVKKNKKDKLSLISKLYIPRHIYWLDTLYQIYVEIYFTKIRNVQTGEIQKHNYVKLCNYVSAIHDNKTEKQKNGKLIQGFSQLWNGKHGLIRNNILGKRINNNARTVIGPDSSCKIHEIILPDLFKKDLVTEDYFIPNMDRNLIHSVYDDKTKTFPRFLKSHSTNKIKQGQLIRRYLTEGDYVLLNRQPSLRVQNIVGVRIKKFDPNINIKMNLILTSGFGADFDGDEMNIFCTTGKEAFVETAFWAHPYMNSIDMTTGNCVLTKTQDNVLGYHLMTGKTKKELEFWNEKDIDSLISDAYNACTKQGCSVSLSELIDKIDKDSQIMDNKLMNKANEYVKYNRWTRMIQSGSKGKMKNYEQMTKNVGILLVNGELVPPIYIKDCSKNGFIESNYYDGLKIGEWIQNCMAAREGMISTSIQTGESGYRGRLLCRALEDLTQSKTNKLSNITDEERIGINIGLVLGRELTQTQLDSFHDTGQGKVRGTLNDIIAWLTGRKGGSQEKSIFSSNGNIIISFDKIKLTIKNELVYSYEWVVRLFLYYNIKNLDSKQKNYFIKIMNKQIKNKKEYNTPYGKGNVNNFFLDEYDKIKCNISLPWGRVNLSVNDIENMDNVEMAMNSKKSFANLFVEWVYNFKSDKILELLYEKYYKTNWKLNGLYCSNSFLVLAKFGKAKMTNNLFWLFRNSSFRDLKEEHVRNFVNFLTKNGDCGSITRHGQIYKDKNVLCRACTECPYKEIFHASKNKEIDDLSNLTSQVLTLGISNIGNPMM